MEPTLRSGMVWERVHPGPLTVSDALRRIFSLTWGELRSLLPLVLLAYLPSLLLAAGNVLWVSEDPQRVARDGWQYSLLQMPVAVLARLLAEGAVIPLVFARLRGGSMAPGEALRLALSRLLPLLGLSLALGLVIWAGLMVCFVPGVILYCTAYVAVPVLMVERVGVEASVRRSFDLTAGYRWEVFGVVFVLWLVGFVLGLSSAVFTPFVYSAEGLEIGYFAAMTVLQQLAGLVGTVLTAVAATVVYHTLRVTKEGMAEEDLVEVFA